MAGSRYDVIVVGVGAMGSATCYHLARRGKRVLGLERFGIPHAMGSSHGTNRIIRLAYYEDPSYVPLLRRAFDLWRSLERGFGEQLLYVTGSIDAGHPGSRVFSESLRSSQIPRLAARNPDWRRAARTIPRDPLAGSLHGAIPAGRRVRHVRARDRSACRRRDGGRSHDSWLRVRDVVDDNISRCAGRDRRSELRSRSARAQRWSMDGQAR